MFGFLMVPSSLKRLGTSRILSGCQRSVHWCRKSIQPALLLMRFASEWPLPVTHSAFCAPGSGGLKFHLGKSPPAPPQPACRFLLEEAGTPASHIHFATKICKWRRSPSSFCSDGKNILSEMVCRAKLRRKWFTFSSHTFVSGVCTFFLELSVFLIHF